MKRLTLWAGAMVMAVQPVLADQRPTGIMWMRDSDGIVISVIHPVDYGTFPPVTGIGGGVVYTMGGHVLEFSTNPGGTVSDMAGSGAPGVAGTTGLPGVAEAAGVPGVGVPGGAAPTATVGGKTYAVEVAGKAVWLRDPVTGVRYATERRMATLPDASGLRINPNGFALE